MAFSALAGLETLLHLVDDVDAALAAHELVGAMARTQRFQRVTDLHSGFPIGLTRLVDRRKNEAAASVAAGCRVYARFWQGNQAGHAF